MVSEFAYFASRSRLTLELVGTKSPKLPGIDYPKAVSVHKSVAVFVSPGVVFDHDSVNLIFNAPALLVP
jgi:hypothetical protein